MSDNFPLSDIRVLDLSRVLAGPFAGRMLADLGADVVKIEPPEKDVTRNWGRKVGSISGYYHQQNAGKKNLCIDLKQADGAKLLKSLVSKADVLIENFRPDVMRRLGIDWDTLQPINPGLVMLSISGFGQQGPEAGRAAYAPIIHAETGSIYRQAQKTGSRPVEMCMSFADTNAGLHGLVALLAALHLRQRTGKGQHIDIAMVDAMIATDDQTHYHLEQSVVSNNASEVWEATGGPVILAGDFRYIWHQATVELKLADPTPPNSDLATKIEFRRKAFAEFMLSFDSRGDLIQQLNKANLAWGSVYNTDEYLQNSETLQHRNSIQQIDDRQGGTRPTFQSPYRFSDASSGVRNGAPWLGEHNEEILTTWLGMQADEILAFQEQQVILSDGPAQSR
ncbi:MAG: CaiB/BaiF CoA-transferase family protein [bacterium]|nr:CoA transferase [Gammaproteobacteria bacterium]HIL95805.1 CoA transferase [Pseudomonadales bacterium]